MPKRGKRSIKADEVGPSEHEHEEPVEIVDLTSHISKVKAILELEDLVTTKVIVPESARRARQKYEELRAAVIQNIATEKSLEIESRGLFLQLQNEQTEFKKICLDAKEDETTLDLLREDHEQAEQEAALCREKENVWVVETNELVRLIEEYKKKLEDIQNEYDAAVAPITHQLKVEIQDSLDRIGKDKHRGEQIEKEVEELREKVREVDVELGALRAERVDCDCELLSLEGIPEKYRKQGDILINSLQNLRLSEARHIGKLDENDHELASINKSIEELTEEHARGCMYVDRTILLIEQKERAIEEVQRDHEMATIEADQYIADKINLEIQLKAIMTDLKLEQDNLAQHVKEKDKVIRKLKADEMLVDQIQGHIPGLLNERESLHHQVIVVQGEKTRASQIVNDLRKEIDSHMHNFIVVENLGKVLATKLLESHALILKIEKDVALSADLRRAREQQIVEMTKMCQRMNYQVCLKTNMWKAALEKIRAQDILLKFLHKREDLIQKRAHEFEVLFRLIKTQRNRFKQLSQVSSLTIEEMKDKLKMMDSEVDMLHGEVVYKNKVITRMRIDFEASIRARTQLQSELTKANIVLRDKKENHDDLELDLRKLQAFIRNSDGDMCGLRKEYEFVVTRRNHTGISLIDRNDELCILYEKSNVQTQLLKQSEIALLARNDEVAFLRLEIKQLSSSNQVFHKFAPEIRHLKGVVTQYKDEMSTVIAESERLSEMVEKPENTKRWRLLTGQDPTDLELGGKLFGIEERIALKLDQTYEKDLILEEVTDLTEELWKQTAEGRIAHLELGKQVNDYHNRVRIITKRMMATVSELSLYQATAMSLKQETESLAAYLEEACQRVEAGEAPTEDAAREWERIEMGIWQAQQNEETQSQGKRERNIFTTAEQRPNAYIAEEPFGLPKPFGGRPPFKPSERGSTMRHIRRPEPKPVVI